jgi:hypothetical protein
MTVHFPPEVDLLLRDAVESFEQLEILVLLHRSGPASLDSIALAIAAGRDRVEAALELLSARGFLSRDGALYDSAPQWREPLGQLVALYDDDALAVMQRMASTSVERARASALRAFSSRPPPPCEDE